MSQSYTQAEVQHRANHVKRLGTITKASTIHELELMAEGKDPDGLRTQYYPGKPDQFFKDVLTAIRD